MQEINVTVLSGNIGEVTYGRTATNGADFCSFSMFIDEDREHTTVVRVNIFGSLTRHCRDKQLQKGDFVIVDGELMNRVLKNTYEKVLEVRCRDIKVLKKPSVSNNQDSGSPAHE